MGPIGILVISCILLIFILIVEDNCRDLTLAILQLTKYFATFFILLICPFSIIEFILNKIFAKIDDNILAILIYSSMVYAIFALTRKEYRSLKFLDYYGLNIVKKLILGEKIKLPKFLRKNNKPANEIKTSVDFFKNIENQIKEIKGKEIKIFWVGDSHRSHPWSLMPGGNTVIVLFKDLNCYGYDKVKRPDMYMSKVIGETIKNIYSRNDNIRYDTLEEYLEEIFIVRPNSLLIEKAWNRKSKTNFSKSLEKYRTK